MIQQEQEKSDLLSRKLEGEQKAAKRIGQDITRYVQDMKQLEQQVQIHVKEKIVLEERLGKCPCLSKRFSIHKV